ncbi:MAG: hypothetical protein ABI551_04385 [Polyangiaceae bacterium]
MTAAGALVVALWPNHTRACGLTPPVGPSGLPTICHGDHAARFHVGVAGGGTWTTIRYGAELSDFVQTATVASLDVNPLVGTFLEPLTLSVTAGAALGGHVDYSGTRYSLRPGFVGGVGASYRFFGRNGLPFLQPQLSYSIVRTSTRGPGSDDIGFAEKDWRVGLAVGKVVGGFAAPFVVARVFGGGTEWAVGGGHGSDHFRYHVGAGSAFALSERFDAVVELAVLGERRATMGVGYTF